VQFVIKRDPAGQFHFASLQSKTGKSLLAEYGVKTDSDSVILLENGRFFTHSTAALRICCKLSGGWKSLSLLLWIPRQLRDWVYRQVARRRYQWFGRNQTCLIPDMKFRERFLDWNDGE
jgi:predicted DCC family thiol-disulfide oxidoreductase YuxK